MLLQATFQMRTLDSVEWNNALCFVVVITTTTTTTTTTK